MGNTRDTSTAATASKAAVAPAALTAAQGEFSGVAFDPPGARGRIPGDPRTAVGTVPASPADSAPHGSAFVWAPAPFQSQKPRSTLQRATPCACGGRCPRCRDEDFLHQHYDISRPDDPHEREAARIARWTAHSASTGAATPGGSPGRVPSLPRLSRSSTTTTAPPPSPSQSPSPSATTATLPVAVQETLRLPGRPLDLPVRSFMEARLGAELGQVRIHDDPVADASAAAVNARAYTVGSHIAFQQGQFAPESDAGRELLAHELVHVLQNAPGLSRDQNPPAASEPAPCHSGHVEGSAGFITLTPELAQLVGTNRAYRIWGTWRAGDTHDTYNRRIFPLWIRWRFGALTAAAQARMLSEMLAATQTVYEQEPVPGCQYFTVLPTTALAQAESTGQRDLQEQRQARGAEAEAREREAGLPEAPDAPAHPPTRRSGSEYEGGTAPTTANAPALPAHIVGPQRQATGGIGTYTMRLEYSFAGSDTLSQVAEAMNWVSYHWERYDITALVQASVSERTIAAVQRHRPVSRAATVGHLDATDRRAEHTLEQRSQETRQSLSGLAHPIDAAHGGGAVDVLSRAYANYLNLALLPASDIVTAGGFALGALADLLGGAFQEREIPWPRQPGYYLIRCIAQPAPQGRREPLLRRAPSVDTLIVEVRPPERLASDNLGEPEADLEETRLRLLVEDNPYRRIELERQLADQQLAATGSTEAVIRRALERKTAERDAATGRARERLEEERLVLEQRLTLLLDQRGGRLADQPVYRPRATFASEVSGETYPLLLHLFELPQDGRFTRYRLADVTSRDGSSWTGRGASADQAIWNAFAEMATHNELGRGRLAVRLAEPIPVTTRERVLPNAPADWSIARQRLADLATVLAALGLFVTGAGEVAAVLGAALAAERLARRWQEHRLRLDAESVGDVITIVGAVAQGAQVVGRMRVVRASNRFILVAEAGDDAAVLAAARNLSGARDAARLLDIANHVANAGGLLWGDLVILSELADIQRAELAGTLSHAEARRRRAARIASAIRDNGIAALSYRQQFRNQSPPATPPAASHAAPGTSPTTPHAAPDASPTSPHRVPATPDAPARPHDSATPQAPRPAAPGAPHPTDSTPGRPRGETIPEAELQRDRDSAARREPETPPHAAGPSDAPAPARDRVRARATTPDGLHQVFVLADGRIFRCSANCTQIRQLYAEFLEGTHPDDAQRNTAQELNRRLAELENQERDLAQRRAVGEAVPVDADQHVAQAVADLDVRMRDFAAPRLAAELGAAGPGVRSLLDSFTPAEVRQLHQQLPPGHFDLLLGQPPEFLREFARVRELTQVDGEGARTVLELLRLAFNQTNPARRGEALRRLTRAYHELGNFLSQHPHGLTGDLASRFFRATGSDRDAASARAEIQLARDLIEGHTPMGPQDRLEAFSDLTSPGQPPPQGERAPEYRVHSAGGPGRLAEVKRVGTEAGPLRENQVRDNVREAAGQISGQARRTGETQGLIRIDARHTQPTALTPPELLRMVIGELVATRQRSADPSTTFRALDYVRWVEIFYVDAAGTHQRLVIENRSGTLVIASGPGAPTAPAAPGTPPPPTPPPEPHSP